jgi:hypothetical protein
MESLTHSKFFRFIKHDLIFILLFTAFATAYYDSVLEKGPLNIHLWRQTDCLSIAHHYAEGNGLFHPEMHIQLGDDNTSGKSAGEFPILYYIVGKIWSLVGESYLVYRLFYLIILFAGLYSFYKSLLILFKDVYWANIIALLFFTSPIYVFFGVSFLTDVPAISFIFVALHFLLLYSKKKWKLLFFVSMGFFALAGLVKISSLIAFVFLSMIFFLELFPVKTLGNRKLFNHRFYEWAGFFAVVILNFSWYLYARHYNEIHGFKYTLTNIYPLWLIQSDEFYKIIEQIKSHILPLFFSKYLLFPLLILSIINLLLWKKIQLFAYLSSITISIGAIVYFVLWAPLMGIHEYYYSAFLILFPGVIIPFVWYIKTNHYKIFKGFVIKAFVGIFLLYNFFYCLSVTRLKTSTKEIGTNILIKDTGMVKHIEWFNWNMKYKWKRYEQMRPYVREIGIDEDDKVICIPDGSPNRSLYLLGQKGWTTYIKYSSAEEIEYLIQKGAKYLFISDPEYLNKEYLQPFINDQIGDFKGIMVFKL